jgi:hypothetical protein
MNDVQMARGLGWFSLGLGALEVAAAPKLGKMFGVKHKASTFRTLGTRELGHGFAILRKKIPSHRAVFSRVIGDIIDAGAFANAMRHPRARRGRIAGAIAFVAAAGIVDYLVACSLARRAGAI